MLPRDIENIIYKMKQSITVHEINHQIKNLKRKEYLADDIYCHNTDGITHFWDTEHNVYAITTNKKYKIRPIHLDYSTYRNLGFQWTYICNDCGEYLKLHSTKIKKGYSTNLRNVYYCNCCDYVY